ncbi:TRAP transporter substrate-binding protein DctP [Cloacibacillus evryensis]|uniref:TRAP transporter substrate-binding protein DctP n=1 Tax=Cloacibacillus evryensis TaxID=508460 RepID=UPI0026E04411|nr:TRAP transporter substrate-binding protein DctP [Cloacibacillus evryensis]
MNNRTFRKIIIELALVIITAVPSMAKTTLRFAGVTPLEQSDSQRVLKFCERVKKETNGEVIIKYYPASQLGDYTLIYEELMRGTIDIGLIPLVSQFDPAFAICSASFLAKDYADVRKLYTPGGLVYDKTNELNIKKGVKFMGFNVKGFGGLGLVKEPVDVLNPNVNKRLLVRTSPNDILKLSLESMMYRTVTIPWSDLYTAMQTGVCDGWIGGTAEDNYASMRDVIKYYYELNIYVEATTFLMSQKAWGKLTGEQQKIVSQVFKDAALESINTAESISEENREKMRKAGVNVFEYDQKQLTPIFKKGREHVWRRLNNIIGKKTVDEMFKDVKD